MKKWKSVLFSVVLCVLMLLGTATMAYAYVMENIGYQSYYPGYVSSTSSKLKSDDSSAVAYYISGPHDKMNVEIWASDGTSANADNYTVSHWEEEVQIFLKVYVVYFIKHIMR